MKRKRPSAREELAAALFALGEVPYADAKQMTADQMRSLYQFHHDIPHAEGGADAFWNLTPVMIAAHRKRTREIDVPRIAKNKRVSAKQAEHQLRMAVKLAGDAAPFLAKPKRGSWGYQGLKRKISGRVVKRV